jgi:hypothetical protein
MAYRADTAKPLYKYGGFPVRPSLDKSLKPAKFNDVKTGLRDIILIIQMDCDLTVAFHPGYGFYRDLF